MKKNLKSFIREEDWKTIKKSILISSLWLIAWFSLTNTAIWVNNHTSWTWANYHTSWHSNHTSHSSY